MRDKKTTPTDRIGLWVFFSLLIMSLAVGGLGYWSMTTRIDGAIIAPGMVALETDRQRVQHLEGGIIYEIHVSEDDAVQQGQILVTLDTTRDQAELNALTSQIALLSVRKARLQAELNGDDFLARAAEFEETGNTREIFAGEAQLFESRAVAKRANIAQLETQKQALVAQVAGLRSQIKSQKANQELTQEELETVAGLHEKGLANVTRLLQVRRTALDLEAGLSLNVAQIDSVQAQIAEVESALVSSAATSREEVSAELTQISQQLREALERQTTAHDRIARSQILAPLDGRVLNLGFHTKGGVIAPGQAIMDIVPVAEQPVLMANIPVTEIDRVVPGQEARVRLTAFNYNQTPELDGSVKWVSADTISDPVTGAVYYSAEVEVSTDEFAKIQDKDLVPGMPVEIMVSTGERLVASYLSRPIRDAMSRTFRDE
ncbi:HlyD family type I secretion periplasmic adaptor subunit [Ruegeria sp.]|uniref:HlyD family type I secretion periplasmic adaptor subunit n=1 Tax=Ruegeria sp. TaxID=1879320 RepID=UPI002309F526|nr:HlyD family type I secretion periplasmic adaptor subunit [Ruegeria sp.]MDA7965352.1 HlyD family type I secretion periplasmic adaptor subunit [Ruegeria sp.]